MPIKPMPDPKSGLHPAVKGGAIAAAIALTLAGIYHEEGGYSNSKTDPGGATNFGVTEHVARAAGYRGDMRVFPKHCAGPATACADAVYMRDYIVKPGFMPLFNIEPAVAHKLVDASVNVGTGYPQIWFRGAMKAEVGSRLQAVNGARSTGPLGATDMANYRAAVVKFGPFRACTITLDAIDGAQAARYRMLAARRPQLRIYLKGWLANRVGNVPHDECLKGN